MQTHRITLYKGTAVLWNNKKGASSRELVIGHCVELRGHTPTRPHAPEMNPQLGARSTEGSMEAFFCLGGLLVLVRVCGEPLDHLASEYFSSSIDRVLINSCP